MAQTEIEVLGFFGFDDFAGGIPDFGFDAAAANGAGHGTVLAHQQLGAFITRYGTANLNDGCDCALLP